MQQVRRRQDRQAPGQPLARLGRRCALAMVAVLVAGCSLFDDPPAFQGGSAGDTGAVDTGSADTGGTDTGQDTGGVDTGSPDADSCDPQVDCESRAAMTASCDGQGQCVYTCQSGFVDLDGQLDTGCECEQTGPETCNGADDDCDGIVDNFGKGGEVAVGQAHSCVLTAAGEVWCWGQNDNGQLGDGTTIERPSPVQMSLPAAPVDIDAFTGRTAVVLAGEGDSPTGGVQLWGGPFPTGPQGVTKWPGAPDPIEEVAVGDNHHCVRFAGGEVWCAGYDDEGQLGDGPTRESGTLVSTGITNARAIDAGVAVSCAVGSDGFVYCWGRNDRGQLGRETPDAYSDTPSPVVTDDGSIRFDALSVWSGGCGVTSTGDVRCWPGEVANTKLWARDAARVAHGSLHTCVLDADGVARCFGQNPSGQIGNGESSLENVNTPTPVVGDHRFASISAGEHNCAVTLDGEIYCWGSNYGGQLGQGNTGGFSGVPVKVTCAD